jgi:hypothetical protein
MITGIVVSQVGLPSAPLATLNDTSEPPT